MDASAIRKQVRDQYGEIARQGGPCCDTIKGCCGAAPAAEVVGRLSGYSEEELAAAPKGANLGLGCGNPTLLASLREGDAVLDLGSGAGLDCFLAAQRVGPQGKVIGVDMTPEMVEKARENAAKAGAANVEFRLGEIEHLPVADSSVDVIISNCVINLSPAKAQVFAEAYRVLRPGGRVLFSDIILTRELPAHVLESLAAYGACVAGAISRAEYLELLSTAGFQDVRIATERVFDSGGTEADEAASSIADALGVSREILRAAGAVASIDVSGIKPSPSLARCPFPAAGP